MVYKKKKVKVVKAATQDAASLHVKPSDEQVSNYANYEPSEDEAKIIAEDQHFYRDKRDERQKHEPQWFINSAMFRGQQYVEWNTKDAKIQVPKSPPHRQRLVINRIFPKIRARIAKFIKNRPKPIVIPATTDVEDIKNAESTQMVLDYLWNKLGLEVALRRALYWAKDCGRAYWWFYWDDKIEGRVRVKDEVSGIYSIKPAELGDICIEVGSPFEVLVEDPSVSMLDDQPSIMRVKWRKIDDVKARYKDRAAFIEATVEDDDLNYRDKIASLNAKTSVSSPHKPKEMVLVKERFIKPCGKYPKGAYRVLAGDVLVKNDLELPYKFYDLKNPYPVVEFIDIFMEGQYWTPTMIEQLVPLQKEYNFIRSKLAEQIRLHVFPKILVAKQHQLPAASWTTEGGEKIEYTALPGIPPPQPWVSPNILADAWAALRMIREEFDDITQVYPASEGKVAGANSGFQTNLLQEATDSVHAPDARLHELTIEAAAVKMRRMAKEFYDVPRLISVVGEGKQLTTFEFSNSQIDEFADIKVQAGSSLPDLKYARIQSVMTLFKEGIFGPPMDPSVQRKVRGMLDFGGFEAGIDMDKVDQDEARIENEEFKIGTKVERPQFYQNHRVHREEHTLVLKSPKSRMMQPDEKNARIAHIIQHLEYEAPQSAVQVAKDYDMLNVLRPETVMMAQQNGQLPPPPPPVGNPMIAPQPPQMASPLQPSTATPGLR